MEDDKIYQVGTNIQEKASVIRNVANAIFGIFKPHEYGKVILPMTAIQRVHDCLTATHAEVLAAFSHKAQDILTKFRFEKQFNTQVKHNALFLAVQKFDSLMGYPGVDKISAVDCGCIFEEPGSWQKSLIYEYVTGKKEAP